MYHVEFCLCDPAGVAGCVPHTVMNPFPLPPPTAVVSQLLVITREYIYKKYQLCP